MGYPHSSSQSTHNTTKAITVTPCASVTKTKYNIHSIQSSQLITSQCAMKHHHQIRINTAFTPPKTTLPPTKKDIQQLIIIIIYQISNAFIDAIEYPFIHSKYTIPPPTKNNNSSSSNSKCQTKNNNK